MPSSFSDSRTCASTCSLVSGGPPLALAEDWSCALSPAMNCWISCGVCGTLDGVVAVAGALAGAVVGGGALGAAVGALVAGVVAAFAGWFAEPVAGAAVTIVVTTGAGSFPGAALLLTTELA